MLKTFVLKKHQHVDIFMQHLGSLGCDHISGSVKNPFIWNTGGGYMDDVLWVEMLVGFTPGKRIGLYPETFDF